MLSFLRPASTRFYPLLLAKAFRYRLYPNQAQQDALAIQFGHAHYVCNWDLPPARRTIRSMARVCPLDGLSSGCT